LWGQVYFAPATQRRRTHEVSGVQTAGTESDLELQLANQNETIVDQ
jgi:hypothetical protein